MTEQAPLWQVEDMLTGARQEAQEGDREACREKIEQALEMV